MLSMPWASLYMPSVQLGCLKAFLDKKYGDNDDVRVYTYSAFLDIVFRCFPREHDIWRTGYIYFEELPFFLLLLKRFNPLNLKSVAKLHDGLLRKFVGSIRFARTYDEALVRLDLLEEHTINYLERELVPRLSRRGVNVIGFSITFNQFFSSLFAYYHLHEKYAGKYKMVFLLGGGTIELDLAIETAKRYGIDAYVVKGEGETKLERIIDLCLSAEEGEGALAAIQRKIAGMHQDYIYLGRKYRKSKRKGSVDVSLQLLNIDELPAPDYSEYYETMARLYPDSKELSRIKRKVRLPLEGSRGCPYKCDYCGLNPQWKDFRGKSTKSIYRHLDELSKRYRCRRMHFVDNTCDSWILKLSELIIGKGRNYKLFAELRTKHPERLWVMMNLAGFNQVQLGCEALSGSLLRRMNKGTTVLDNLKALKYCRELEMHVIANLIIYHPKTKLNDVIETRRVLDLIPHFVKFDMSYFELQERSEIYRSLGSKKEKVERCNWWGMDNQLLGLYSYRLELPRKVCLSKRALAALDDFNKEYEEVQCEDDFLVILSQGKKSMRIFDSRYECSIMHQLMGPEVAVYDACHQGLTFRELVEVTKLSRRGIMKILDELVQKKLIVYVDENYLSLALRPKDKLTAKYRTNRH